MSKSQLPLLTSIIMVTQAFLSAPAGIRAKRSIKDRNQVLLLGYAAMIAADLSFALIPSVLGELYLPTFPTAAPVGFHLVHKNTTCESIVLILLPIGHWKTSPAARGVCQISQFPPCFSQSAHLSGMLEDINERGHGICLSCDCLPKYILKLDCGVLVQAC